MEVIGEKSEPCDKHALLLCEELIGNCLIKCLTEVQIDLDNERSHLQSIASCMPVSEHQSIKSALLFYSLSWIRTNYNLVSDINVGVLTYHLADLLDGMLNYRYSNQDIEIVNSFVSNASLVPGSQGDKLLCLYLEFMCSNIIPLSSPDLAAAILRKYSDLYIARSSLSIRLLLGDAFIDYLSKEESWRIYHKIVDALGKDEYSVVILRGHLELPEIDSGQ